MVRVEFTEEEFDKIEKFLDAAVSTDLAKYNAIQILFARFTDKRLRMIHREHVSEIIKENKRRDLCNQGSR